MIKFIEKLQRGLAVANDEYDSLDEMLAECKEVGEFDRIFAKYKFPKDVDERIKRLEKATGVSSGSFMLERITQNYPGKNKYFKSALYEDFKLYVVYKGMWTW